MSREDLFEQCGARSWHADDKNWAGELWILVWSVCCAEGLGGEVVLDALGSEVGVLGDVLRRVALVGPLVAIESLVETVCFFEQTPDGEQDRVRLFGVVGDGIEGGDDVVGRELMAFGSCP